MTAGRNRNTYRQLESLAEYLLVSQEKCHVEPYVRQPDHQWLLSESKSLQQTIRLPPIGCELALAEIYDKVASANAAETG